MDFQTVGRILLVVGIVIALIGGAIILLGSTGIFNRLGSLPGDIRIEGQGWSCLIPIVSSILISVLLTVLLNIVLRLINRQ